MPKEMIGEVEETEQVNVKYYNIKFTCDTCNKHSFLKVSPRDYYVLPKGWSHGYSRNNELILCDECTTKAKDFMGTDEYKYLTRILQDILYEFPYDDDNCPFVPLNFNDMEGIYLNIEEIMSNYDIKETK